MHELINDRYISVFIAAALCEDPQSPQFGSIQCHQGTVVKECTVTCQPGFKFEYQPADKYSCATDGTWTPPKTSMPNCIPGTKMKRYGLNVNRTALKLQEKQRNLQI